MAVSPSNSLTWEEIELSESYLVSSMYEEALDLASSILNRICRIGTSGSAESVQLEDMMESAGMVLVQSLKELGRTSEMMKELKDLFGSVAAIPVQVLLTGACFQISEGCSSGLQEIFEEFLCKWKYVDGQSYVLENQMPHATASEACTVLSVLAIEKYLEVSEVYVFTLLGTVLGDIDLAISWVEKAELPEEKCEEMLRRLHSLYSHKQSTSACVLVPSQSSDRNSSHTHSGSVTSQIEGFSGTAENANGLDAKPAIMKSKYPSLECLFEKINPCFWWFRMVTLKFGDVRLVVSHGRVIIWGSLVIAICYIFRRKGTTVKQFASRKATSFKKALVDAWQLAFSFQVNPLAATQPLSHGTRVSS